MRLTPSRVTICVVSAISVVVLRSAAQMVSDRGAPPPTKTALQFYKNIQVLKVIPADQLIPAMQFITASLGVQCDFCHLENAFEKDDREPKQTARKMIQMMLTLNRDDFQGQRKVTCYACHRGARKPVITPVLRASDKSFPQDAPPKPSPNTPGLSNADTILEKYRRALGERSAKISTRIQQGTLTVGAKSFPVEVISEAPHKRLVSVHFADGDNITAVNGKEGWSSTPGDRTHDMGPSEFEGAQLEADLFFANNLRSIFKELEVLGTDSINGKNCLLVSGTRDNALPTYLYFETESGLLMRMLRYTETPLGNNPTEIDYADYREQDGRKTPFQWSVSRPGRQSTVQIESMQEGVPIDPSKFVRPGSSPAR
jgi:photosynthetic reaction center cytochrome c subunit